MYSEFAGLGGEPSNSKLQIFPTETDEMCKNKIFVDSAGDIYSCHHRNCPLTME